MESGAANCGSAREGMACNAEIDYWIGNSGTTTNHHEPTRKPHFIKVGIPQTTITTLLKNINAQHQ